MILQLDGAVRRVDHKLGQHAVACGSQDRGVILRDDTVVKHRHMARSFQAAILDARAGIDKIIGLPISGRAGSVRQRRRLAVDRRCLPVGVAPVVVAIENLDFLETEQKRHRYCRVPLPGRRYGRRHSIWNCESPNSWRVRMSPAPLTTSM